MKKLICAFVIVLVSLIVFTSCEKELNKLETEQLKSSGGDSGDGPIIQD